MRPQEGQALNLVPCREGWPSGQGLVSQPWLSSALLLCSLLELLPGAEKAAFITIECCVPGPPTRRRRGGGATEPPNHWTKPGQWSEKCQCCVFWALRRGQVRSVGEIRKVFLGEAAFELRPEGSGALALAERREAVLTWSAGLQCVPGVTEERGEAEGSVWCEYWGGGALPESAPVVWW